MPDYSRRAALSLMIAVPALTLAACTRTQNRAVEPTPSSTPRTGVPASLRTAAVPSGALAAAVFGPNGGHWPTRTPRASDKFDLVVEAECTWADIARAISFVTERTPNGKGLVLVKPGILPGNGAGSSSAPVLQLVGALGRPYRVLVAPRDGVGSITHSASMRIDRVRGVAFMGFWPFPNSLVLSSVEDVAWGWSKGQAFNITAGAGGPARGIELVECVTPDARMTESDAWAFRTAGNLLEDVSVVGSYIAPSYKPAGSSAHCDTLQLSGDHAQNRVTLTDSVLFASTNAGFIPSSLATAVAFNHTLIVASDRMLQRYALPAGANAFTSGVPAAVNGTGTVGLLSATDSTFVGALQGTWASIQNTTVSGNRTAAPASGSVQIDSSLSRIDAGWLEARTPMPTDDRLRAIWTI